MLFEAFKTASLPNFLLLKETLAKAGKLRKAFINYCQYSSRYQRYLDGENPNTFNPAFSNGSIMDIGFYCLASAVALWGEPRAVLATASLLDSGVDAQGTVVLSYGDFDVTLHHSKVSDSAIPSEIQGEDGTLVIEKISECQKLAFVPRGGKAQDLTQPQHIILCCMRRRPLRAWWRHRTSITGSDREPYYGKNCRAKIRRQTGVIFPADTQPAGVKECKRPDRPPLTKTAL
ncbi:oxidoreductase [Klebsiella variicola]|nr:oxidoreductase [Klebsiella variicola]